MDCALILHMKLLNLSIGKLPPGQIIDKWQDEFRPIDAFFFFFFLHQVAAARRKERN